MIRLETKGSQKFPKWIKRLPDAPEAIMRGIMGNVRQQVLQEARKNVTKGHAAGGLNRRTGNLYRNLRTRLETKGRKAEVRLTGPFYGRVNARGAVIVPKQAPYLVFQVGGRWVRSRRVVIPARPWDTEAMETVRGRFPAFYRKELRRLLGE